MNNKGLHRVILLFVILLIIVIFVIAAFYLGLNNVVKEILEKRIIVME